ncbi:MAG: short-chain dehydrogenase, partial [Leptospiraceae bacterium]|nr:short-chain dehydrogenase [Leptospiraceae bacterium]
YGQSKFANLLFAKDLAERFKGTKKAAFSVHPGVIRTNLSRHLHPLANFLFGLIGPLFLKTVEEGAATQCYAATAKDLTIHSGSYLQDCNISKPRPDAENPELARKLREESERIITGL